MAALQVAQIAGSEPSGLPSKLGARGGGWGGHIRPPRRLLLAQTASLAPDDPPTTNKIELSRRSGHA